MNAEYQRLEAEASEVQQQINELVSSCSQMAAADFQKFEAKIAVLHQRLMGLRQGMGLLKLAGSAKMQAQAANLAKSQPKTFHSQGTRPKTVQLTGGVTVTLHVTYYHRFQCPEKAKNKKANRGMFPMLILLVIANGFTAGVRQRMMKCAALLGSYEEAVQMLDDEGIRICVNTLRKVTAGMGEMLARLTKSGSVKVSGNAAGRRIVVTTDGGRVRLREKRRGRTKKGHKRFKPAWREPRLFMIYATDDQGKIDTTFSPGGFHNGRTSRVCDRECWRDDRLLAVSPVEDHSACGNPIDVRCLDDCVAITAEFRSQIIDSDEQHVCPVGSLQRHRRKQSRSKGEENLVHKHSRNFLCVSLLAHSIFSVKRGTLTRCSGSITARC